jgi:hypothetical protein
MNQLAFQALLADRRIPIHYGLEEFREDVRTLRKPERFSASTSRGIALSGTLEEWNCAEDDEAFRDL